MSVHGFHNLLEQARLTSRWPERPDFCNRVGVSVGGFRKFEDGTRIPTPKMLERIIDRAAVNPELAHKLRVERDRIRALKIGLSLDLQNQIGRPPINIEKLTERMITELSYVLRQDGVHPTPKSLRVLRKRFFMLLNSLLEDR